MRFLGSKQQLLTNIEEILIKHVDGDESTFLDLFAGTNVVGQYFKKDYTIFSNDILFFSYVNARATIENNDELKFEGLANIGITNPISYLQDNADRLDKNKSNYYEMAYTPSGGSMYFSVENGKRIDFIRDILEEWKKEQLITNGEYYYLLSTLIESVPYISNITGTYGAYLKFWDKRSQKRLDLQPLEILDNGRANKAYNEDANELVKKLKADIVYIDTPYNSRQYASNYHVLENIARNNNPDLNGKTKIFDWKNLKSTYSMKSKALESMEDLIKNIDAKHVIVSYNDEGIIPLEDLIFLLKRHSLDGIVDVEFIDYRKYKSKIGSQRSKVREVLMYIRKRKASTINKETSNTDITASLWGLQKKKYIKSPLNYVGGKYKLLSQILPLFPENIDTFIDLFSGGANVGINVNANKHIFNDMNSKINEMFDYFSANDADTLVTEIYQRIDEYCLSKYNEEGFKKFREYYNLYPNPLDLYVLVSYSYNYQIRFNNSMKFNNPFGRNRSHFSKNMERNLRDFVNKLKELDVSFENKLFTDMDLTNLTKDDFVYLDPPYLITTGSYNDGNRGFTNWREDEEIKMYELLSELSSNGVRWALSNVIEHKGRVNLHLKEFIDNSNVTVHYLDYDYSNSSHNTTRGKSLEILLTNYDATTYNVL